MPKKVNINKKGIIFDLDDTIASTKTGKNMGLRVVSSKIYDYLRQRGVDVNLNKLYKEIRAVAQKMDNKKKRILDRNLWWSFVIKEFSKEKPSKKFLNELTKDYWEMVIQKGKLYKDAPAVLTYLKNKGYILGLLTDTDGTKGFKSKRIKSLNFKKWFKTVVIAGEDTKQIKPDKAPLSLITRRLNLKPEECIFVGNDPYVDISGAKRLGMATIFINRHSSKIEVKPDRTITTLNELKQIL